MEIDLEIEQEKLKSWRAKKVFIVSAARLVLKMPFKNCDAFKSASEQGGSKNRQTKNLVTGNHDNALHGPTHACNIR